MEKRDCSIIAIARSSMFLLLLLMVASVSAQQNYPSKVVKIIVGQPAGGPTDALARIIAQALSERLNQSFVVDNRSGANGLIGIQALMNSPPDGYTLMLATSGSMTIAPLIDKNLPYDPLTSFSLIAAGGAYPYVAIGRPDLPVNNIKALIEYSKSNSGKMSYGSSGVYSANHLAGEWLKSLTGLVALHIPYKGVDTIKALAGNEIDFAFASAGAGIPLINSGKIKGLAVTSPQRISQAESLPTMIESGVSGFVVEPWSGIVGPAELPQQIVETLNKNINESLRQAVNKSRLDKFVVRNISDTPESYRRLIEQELVLWGKMVRRIQVDK